MRGNLAVLPLVVLLCIGWVAWPHESGSSQSYLPPCIPPSPLPTLTRRRSPSITEHSLKLHNGLIVGGSLNETIFPSSAVSGEAYFAVPDTVRYAVIDVGTHSSPELLAPCMKEPECFYVGIDPLEHQAVRSQCAPFSSRCVVLPGVVDFREGQLRFYIGLFKVCSSILGGKGCARAKTFKNVTSYTLDRILDFIPPHVLIQRIMTDCQGTDLLAIAGLVRHAHRVQAITLECQDLQRGSSRLHSPLASTCSDSLACISSYLPRLAFRGCRLNSELFHEFNCDWHDPEVHNTIHDFGGIARRAIIYRSPCPHIFSGGWQEDTFFDSQWDKLVTRPTSGGWQCIGCYADSTGYLYFGGNNKISVFALFDCANVTSRTVLVLVSNQACPQVQNKLWLRAPSAESVRDGEWLIPLLQRTNPSVLLFVQIDASIRKDLWRFVPSDVTLRFPNLRIFF